MSRASWHIINKFVFIPRDPLTLICLRNAILSESTTKSSTTNRLKFSMSKRTKKWELLFFFCRYLLFFFFLLLAFPSFLFIMCTTVDNKLNSFSLFFCEQEFRQQLFFVCILYFKLWTYFLSLNSELHNKSNSFMENVKVVTRVAYY